MVPNEEQLIFNFTELSPQRFPVRKSVTFDTFCWRWKLQDIDIGSLHISLYLGSPSKRKQTWLCIMNVVKLFFSGLNHDRKHFFSTFGNVYVDPFEFTSQCGLWEFIAFFCLALLFYLL